MNRARLSDEFAALLAIEQDAAPEELLGLEEEYRLFAGASRVDFRALIHGLSLDGRAIDLRDPFAYRCTWGGLVTADGREAEFAVPPVSLRAGFADVLAAWSEVGRDVLRRAIPPDVRMEGYSTHLSVSLPNRLAVRAANLFVRAFGPALLLITDSPSSPGVLVRPRIGRLELGTEHVSSERLSAIGAFVTGSVRACVSTIVGRPTLMPPLLEVWTQPSPQRFGWHVSSRAAGGDLHLGGSAVLRLARGGTIRAQDHLALAWSAARQALLVDSAKTDLAPMDALAGNHPESALARPISGPPRNPFGPALDLRARRGVNARTVLASWDFVVVRFADETRDAFACVPRRALPRFLDSYSAGTLDGVLRAYLASRPVPPRWLSRLEHTRAPGLFDAVGRQSRLADRERPPVNSSGAALKPGNTPQRPARTIAIGLAVLGLLLLALIARFASGTSAPVNRAPTDTTAPTLSVAAAPTVSGAKLFITGMIQSDSPQFDQCGSSQQPHNVYAFLLEVAGFGQPSPPPSIMAALLGRVAHLTLAGPPDAGNYDSKIAETAGRVQIRFDGKPCQQTTARSTMVTLSIDGLTLQPGAGGGFVADVPLR